MTAEPRMEDLLASIRKAINEDIGGDPAPASHSEIASSPSSRTPLRDAPRTEEPSATASEIQQLREKISRSRSAEAAPPRDPAQRAASLAAALRSDTPRRAWRDIEPPAPPPRLRTSIVEPEAQRAALRADVPARPAQPRYTAERQPAPPSWTSEGQGASAAVEVPSSSRQDPSIMSGGSAQAVQSAFSRLADTVLSRATGERSIEDMTREFLRVMLKQWLDDNLPQMVERLVREEIERVARTGR